MGKFYLFACLITVFLFSFLLCGCSDNGQSTTPTGAVGDVNSAYRELENQMFVLVNTTIDSVGDLSQVNFSYANSLYRGAVSNSPGSSEANFGAGLTEMLSIYSDPQVNDLMKRWESFARGGGMPIEPPIPLGTRNMNVPIQALAMNSVKILQAAVDDPPLIGEMQTMVRNGLLPRIDYALERLAVVEQDTTFEFKISGKMQGDIHYDPLYLDNTEVYIMDGILRGLKAISEQFLVYRFELTAYTAPALAEALQPNNTTFFYRAPDGVTRSRGVLADVSTMIGKFKSAINYFKSETDDQSDDIIKSISAADLDTTLAYLDRALVIITTQQSVRLIDADTDHNNYTLLVNIDSLYNAPPYNPKIEWLPTYTVDTTADGDDIVMHWQAQYYDSLTFPDPTFSHLISSITNDNTLNTDKQENLRRLFHIDEYLPFPKER